MNNIFWCSAMVSSILIHLHMCNDQLIEQRTFNFTVLFALQHISHWRTELNVFAIDGKHLCHLSVLFCILLFSSFVCYYFHFGIKPELYSPNFAYDCAQAWVWKNWLVYAWKKWHWQTHTHTNTFDCWVKIRSLTTKTQSHLTRTPDKMQLNKLEEVK